MHMSADALISPEIATTMGAVVFCAQMISFTIPGTGSSGNIAGGLILSAILGAMLIAVQL